MEEQISGFGRLLKISIGALGAAYTILFFFLSIPRLLFPYEIEWMEGSVLDHAMRIFSGKQLFVAPSIEMVNWQYQPLYYYVVAAAMHIFGVSYFAGRLVSFISIILCSVFIVYLIHNETKSWWYAFVGSSLLFASYGLTGYWFELARVDTLALTFILASVTILVISKKEAMLVISAFFLALAFLTKQQSLFFFLPIVLWLIVTGKRNAIIFFSAFAIFCTAAFLYFTSQNGQWYYYYVFHIPMTMGSSMNWSMISTVLPGYIATQYAAGTLLIVLFLITKWSHIKEWVKNKTGLYLMLAITAMIQLGVFLGHTGAYKNDAIPLAAMMAILIPIAGFHLINQEKDGIKYFILIAFIFQFFGLNYNFQHVPLVRITNKDYEADRAFMEELRKIPGDIFFPQHGFFPMQAGKNIYANLLAAQECSDTGDTTGIRLWNEWENALTVRRYDGIIVDEGVFKPYDSIPGYLFTKVNLGEHPFVTRAGDAVSIPRYLYLPAK